MSTMVLSETRGLKYLRHLSKILAVRGLKVPDRRRNVGVPGNRKDLVQGTEDGVRFRALMREIDAAVLAGDLGQLHNLIR